MQFSENVTYTDMLAIDKSKDEFLYQQVLDLINENIDSGALKPGDRLPSLRQMSKRTGVSVPTVRQAYVELERQRRVESRPQSGFYVRAGRENALVRPAPRFSLLSARATSKPCARGSTARLQIGRSSHT